MRGSSTTSRLLVALGALLLATVATTWLDRAGAQVPGATTKGVEVDKVGWWNELNEPLDTPAGPVTVPAPPDVPEGAIAVGAVNGEADRLAAVGIIPDALPGATVTRFRMTLTEATVGNVRSDADTTVIVACPITSFWVPAVNGTWETQPTFDCDLAKVPGTRDDEGRWTFDLTPIGALWLDPAGTLAADGVVLIEDSAPPESFRAAFDTVADGSIEVVFEATGGGLETTTTVAGPVITSPPDTGGFNAPDVGSGTPDLGPTPEPSVATTTAPGPTPTAAPAPIATSRPGLPGGTVPLFLAVVALLLAASYWLGPAGEPVEHVRERGVSRVLAERARSRAGERLRRY